MNKREFTKVMTLTLAALATLLFAADSLGREQRPNIVLIMADDLGFSDVGCVAARIVMVAEVAVS